MSKGNGWVPIDKALVGILPKLNRKLSEIEAMFAHSVDVDNGRPWTLRGYAEQWQWSVGKVKRLVEGAKNTSGTVVGQKGNGTGTEVHFIDKTLWGLNEQKRNGSRTDGNHKTDGTIYPHPKPREKEGDFSPPLLDEIRDYCRERQNIIDPQAFLDHYTSNGWTRGDSKIKCWKTVIRIWETRDPATPSIKISSTNRQLLDDYNAILDGNEEIAIKYLTSKDERIEDIRPRIISLRTKLLKKYPRKEKS